VFEEEYRAEENPFRKSFCSKHETLLQPHRTPDAMLSKLLAPKFFCNNLRNRFVIWHFWKALEPPYKALHNKVKIFFQKRNFFQKIFFTKT